MSYIVAQGDGAVWAKGSGASCDFVIKRSENDSETFGRFTGLQVDGQTVDPSSYTAEAGSVIVKLKSAYLETLALGKHTIIMSFNDGSASAGFTVEKAASPVGTAQPFATSVPTAQPAPARGAPRTGDESNMGLWIALIAVSSIGLLCAAAYDRRRRAHK